MLWGTFPNGEKKGMIILDAGKKEGGGKKTKGEDCKKEMNKEGMKEKKKDFPFLLEYQRDTGKRLLPTGGPGRAKERQKIKVISA